MARLPPLPIDADLPRLVEALRRHSSVVVQAPTGAGKTTRVPPALLDAGLAGADRIVMLEPRRLAARAAARRMAAERGGRVGDEVGYQVRFDRQSGPATRILVVTEGVLVRMLQDDPFLESVRVVIFDEFHERSLDNDLALAMVRLVMGSVRTDLKLVVMSATLATQEVVHYLANCPVIATAGRQYPVEVLHEARPAHEPWPISVAGAVRRMLDRTAGDLLVFLPGLREIRQTARHLEPLAQARNLAVLPLHGDLPAEQQDEALLPGSRRKVILATNVAETSVTVEGITGVIDTGQARLLVFDPATGLDRLRQVPISKASADQRAGRAGRTQAGVCLRMWNAASHRGRPDQTEPEVRRVDLAGTVLQLLCWGESNLERFPWFELPREETLAQALRLLRCLEALDDGGVTPLGRVLARLPVHPRLGRLLLEGDRLGHVKSAALAAALLAERDPFRQPLDTRDPKPGPSHVSRSDVLDRVEAMEAFEQAGHTDFCLGKIDRGLARFVLHARDQLVRLMRQETAHVQRVAQPAGIMAVEEAILRSLLAAFPDRLARRREPGSARGVIIGGRGVRLAPTSAVRDAELFLGIDVDAGGAEALVRLASAVQRDWLPAHRLVVDTAAAFDPVLERVVARRRLRCDGLVIEEMPAALPDDQEVAAVLAAAARENLGQVLPSDASAFQGYRVRVRCLRDWLPELELPALDEEELRELLPWLCAGCRSFADLRHAAWLAAIQSRLSHRQLQAIEREAPERLEVPSGSRIAVRYELGRPPVLAVRIQELFGWRDTPRLAAGRVPVLLHLLAPNHRPQQVTDDLASFWTNTYPQVRRELRARYPKHAWPEDPWTAVPERHPRRKSNKG